MNEPLTATTGLLVHRWDEAEGLVGLRFAVPESLRSGYILAGQYVQVSPAGSKPGYLAIASRPGEPHFEFLVKGGGEFADTMTALTTGASVAIGPVAGKGYALEAHKGHDVLVFGAGSGISPLRPLMFQLAKDRSAYGAVRLWHGARTQAHLAYRQDWGLWRAAGIEVKGVLSQASHKDFDKGYVQHQLKDLSLNPDRTVAFVCGPKDMITGVQEALAERGLDPARILQNY